MPWYCPNENCPNVRGLNPHENCPICGKKAQKFGGFFGRSPKLLLERKSIIKEWKSPPKCSKCGKEMVPIHPYSFTLRFNEHLRNCFENIHGFAIYLCSSCMLFRCNISDDIFDVWVGKVVRGIDRSTGIMRLRIERPKDKSGVNTVHLPTYRSLSPSEREKIYVKRGDNVAVGGYYQLDGHFIGIYYKNLTVNFDGSLIGYDENISFFQGKNYLKIKSPLFLQAQKMIEEATHDYEVTKEKIVKVSRYHAQAGNFELLIAQLFERMGFKNVYVSGGASDKGVDIEAYLEDPFGNRERVIVQCKHQSPSNKIKPTQIRDFAHAIEREKAHGVIKGYFITSSYFSPECFEEENCGKNMELIDGDRLKKLLKDKALALLD